MSFKDDFEDCETAEDFLLFLGIRYEKRVVDVNRLHILQRFHDYIGQDAELAGITEDEALADRYRGLLQRAYDDFTTSTAVAEKVFKVHQEEARKMADRFVPLDQLLNPPRFVG